MSSDNKNFCPHCGWKLKKKAKFCPKCGMQITTTNNNNSYASNQTVTGVQSVSQSGKTNHTLNVSVFSLIGAGIATLMGICGMISYFIGSGYYDSPEYVLYGFTYLIFGVSLVVVALLSKNRPYLIALPLAFYVVYFIQCFFNYYLPSFIHHASYSYPYSYFDFSFVARLIYHITKIVLLIVAMVFFIMITNKKFRNLKFTVILPICSALILADHIFAIASNGIVFDAADDIFYLISWILLYLCLFVFSLSFVYDKVPFLANLENTFKGNVKNTSKSEQLENLNNQEAAEQNNSFDTQNSVYENHSSQQSNILKAYNSLTSANRTNTVSDVNNNNPTHPVAKPIHDNKSVVHENFKEDFVADDFDKDLEVLEKLMELKEKGVISEEDFEKKKAEILSRL